MNYFLLFWFILGFNSTFSNSSSSSSVISSSSDILIDSSSSTPISLSMLNELEEHQFSPFKQLKQQKNNGKQTTKQKW